MNTIFAQASATGRAGVCVLRISGPHALKAGHDLAGTLPPFRQAGTRKIKGRDGDLIDDALIVAFEGPHSFTGEDVVELHVHGSIAIVRRLLNELGEMDGLRLAEPGEFTRRAMENGKLDLTQVEGLADLVEAETEAQRKQALRVLEGDLGKKVEAWRRDLIRAAALLEATIDFADEDVPVDVSPEVCELLDRVVLELDKEIAGTAAAERVRAGFEVAIIGLPNVGKSTLLNRIAGREAAITSDLAGTTRDVLEVRIDLKGLPVTFLDTAGLRESDDHIERIGVARAVDRAKGADLRVFMRQDGDILPLEPDEVDLLVRPKADVIPGDGFGVSGVTGEGISELLDEVGKRLEEMASSAGLATRARHAAAMAKSVGLLRTAAELVEAGPDQYDIAAAELGFSIRALEALVGRIDVESLLDEIFASFCLGK